MSWWMNALYNTCSLITLDKMLLDRPGMAKHFGTVQALAVSFTADRMRSATASRARSWATSCPLPSPADLAAILGAANLSKSLAQVDTLVYAAAVHHQIAVVTGDKRLARALLAQKLRVGNLALVLKELVRVKKLTRNACDGVLAGLAARDDFLLGTAPPTWASLRGYRFPD